MHGVTDDSTDYAWADIVTTWSVLVDDAYQALVAHHGRLRQPGPAPTVADSEGITIALMADTFVHGNAALCLAIVRH